MRGPLLRDLGLGNTSVAFETTRNGKARKKRQSTESPSAASFYIKSLPGLDAESNLKLFGGHLPSTPASDPTSDSHLYFFLAKNRHIADRERLVIWLNGGPGCSSFDGALMEVGPFRLQEAEGSKTPTLREVDGAWNEYANLLFLDQPAGTGYSYVSTNHYVHDLDIAADHVVEFLRQFYKVFPEYAEMDTYIAGESYAGQYIPYVADAITKTNEIKTPLKGLLIGNGWIDPWTQYPAYVDFAIQNGIITEGSPSHKTLHDELARCNASMTENGRDRMSIHDGACEGILHTILESTVQVVNGQKLCVNTYDIRLTDRHPSCGMNWPPDLTALYDYLPREDVKSAFHASSKEGGWVECSGPVGGNFQAAGSKPSVSLLPGLLEKMPILLFAGEQDLICNWLGVQRMADELEWNGAQGFADADALDWFVNGERAGTWQSARNLSMVKIVDASHMVPFDRPLAAHDMLLRFVNADLISAAGPAAKIPSRIGAETEAVIGETHPNGTALDNSLPESGSLDPQETALAGPAQTATAYYNTGAAAILILLLLSVAGIFFCLRARTMKFRSQEPELGLAVTPPGTPLGRRSHKRGVSSMSSMARSVNGGRYSRASQSDAHEMDELVTNRDYNEENEKNGDVPKSHRPLEDETLFAVGEDDSDSSSDPEGGADLGRSPKKTRIAI